MSSYAFTKEVVVPFECYLALFLLFCAGCMAVRKWYKDCQARLERREMQQRQEQHAEEEKPVQQIRPAQRMYPCPYCDVHEQANWIAYEAWQKGSKQR